MNTEITRPVWAHAQRGESYTLTLRKPFLDVRVVREVQSRDNPSPTPYAVIVFGTHLARRYASADEAKVAAVAGARRILAEATDNLTAFED